MSSTSAFHSDRSWDSNLLSEFDPGRSQTDDLKIDTCRYIALHIFHFYAKSYKLIVYVFCGIDSIYVALLTLLISVNAQRLQ